MLVWLLAACASAPEPIEPDATGWLGEIATTPTSFATLTKDHRTGWIALHANDATKAYEAFPEGAAGKRRAAYELAILHDDLARLSRKTWDELEKAYVARTGVPDEAKDLFAQSKSCPPVNDKEPLLGPVLVHEGEGYSRRWYDPCLHASFATQWSQRAWGKDWRGFTPGDGLSGTLFGAWLDPAALAADLKAQAHPGLLGTGTLPEVQSAGQDVDAARGEARALQDLLDVWSKQLTEAGDPEGVAVLTDLALLPRFRQEWLIVRARHALLNNQPLRALATLELAVDVTERSVGPRNDPMLYALLAEARLSTGRSREALDALERLSLAVPSANGLKETLGDLAVLQGLDRHGDSKEN